MAVGVCVGVLVGVAVRVVVVVGVWVAVCVTGGVGVDVGVLVGVGVISATQESQFESVLHVETFKQRFTTIPGSPVGIC